MVAAAALSILAQVATIAAYVGADKLVSWIEAKRAKSKGMGTDQILSQLRGKISALQSEDEDLYNQLTNRMANIPQLSTFISSSAKSVVKRASDKAAREIRKVASQSSRLADLSDRATNLANMSDSYRMSKLGKEDFQNIARDIEEVIK